MNMSGRLNGRLTDINGWVLRWWHSWVLLATVSSWTTVSELLFHKWNVPKQNSIKWLPQLENWELLQRLKHQGLKSFSPTLREFQIRELVCQLWEKEKDSKKSLVCGLKRVEQTYTKESANSRRYILCYTLDISKFSRGSGKGEINNAKHDAENMPGIRAY